MKVVQFGICRLIILLFFFVGTSPADRIQFGWRIEENSVDGGARIIDWAGRYQNVQEGVSGGRARFGYFAEKGEADFPYLEDPVSELRLFGGILGGSDGDVPLTFSVSPEALGVGNYIDNNEGIILRFSQDVKLISLYWVDQRNSTVSLTVADEASIVSVPNQRLSMNGLVLKRGDNLDIRVVSGRLKLGAITVETLEDVEYDRGTESEMIAAVTPPVKDIKISISDYQISIWVIIGFVSLLVLFLMVFMLTTTHSKKDEL